MLTRERLSEIENAAKDDHQAHPDWAGPDNSPRRHRDELLEEVRELRAELLVTTAALEFTLRYKLITAASPSGSQRSVVYTTNEREQYDRQQTAQGEKDHPDAEGADLGGHRRQ